MICEICGIDFEPVVNKPHTCCSKYCKKRKSDRKFHNSPKGKGHKRKYLKQSPQLREANRARHGLWRAIRTNQISGRDIKDLGCSIDELKQKFELLFEPGMTWDNWGKVWEIDHINPLCDFDLLNPVVRMFAYHYTNLQPLTKKKNQRKGKKSI